MISHTRATAGTRVRLKRDYRLPMSGKLIPSGTVGSITELEPTKFMDDRWYIWIRFEDNRGAWLPLVILNRIRRRRP